MCKTTTLVIIISLAWLSESAFAQQAEPPALPRVKPLASRTIAIQEWQNSSTSPDGSTMLRGGSDRRFFAMSADGNFLASEDASGFQLETWDLTTGKSMGKFGRINNSVTLAFSPDSKTLLVAENDRFDFRDITTVELWDVAKRKMIKNLDEGVNATPFPAACFSPDGKTIALAAGHGWHSSPAGPTVYLWDIACGDEVRRLTPRTTADSVIDCLCFSGDGKTMALVCDGQVVLCELATGKERGLVGVLPPVYASEGHDRNGAYAIAFSPDGRVLATACHDGLIRLWDMIAGKELLPLAGHEGVPLGLAFSADGKTLLSFGRDSKLLTWPIAEARRDLPGLDSLPATGLAKLWDDLRGKDRLALEEALRILAASPRQTMPLLRERLKPVPEPDAQRLERLAAELAGDDINERKRAAQELRKFGELAIPALQKFDENRRHPVLGKMIGTLSHKHPDQVQALYGLVVLEGMATKEARQLLDELAKGAREAYLTRNAEDVRKRLQQRTKPPPAAKLEVLWSDLASDDGVQAFQAMIALVGRPGEAVPFLHHRLRQLAKLASFDDDPQRLLRLVADLDSADFNVREKATRELAKLGKRAGPALRQALKRAPPLEVQRRIEMLLKNDQWTVSSERLQGDRALEVLELIGGAEVRRVLLDLAKEGQNAGLKEDVGKSLARLGRP